MSKSKRNRANLDDILTGRIAATAGRLIELIHAINPKSPRDEAKYAQKSRLQSLLIEQHGDALLVELDHSSEEIIGLRHRYLGRDACHARISQLEPDAQVWVRKQIDRQHLEGEEESSAAAHEPPAKPADPLLELVEEGILAMERYDFEEAKACLEFAAVESKGEHLAPYLELLVEHLGGFEEALDMQNRVPQSALQHDHVRVLLALAAARSGAPRLAQRLMQSSRDPRVVEVHAALAWYGVRTQDARLAERHLLLLKDRAPTHAEVLSLERALKEH